MIQTIRMKQLCQMLSLSRSTIWRMLREGSLPKPFKLSHHAVGWRLDQIEAWLEQKALISVDSKNQLK